MKRIYIIGLGLLGGSFALNMRRIHPAYRIFGIDASQEHLEEAIRIGLIDAAAEINDVVRADWVILAIPVDASIPLLKQVLSLIKPTAIVFDVGSTKKDICEAVADHPMRSRFLATHPIAGTEYTGPQAAFAGLLTDKTQILCEVEKTDPKAVEQALDLFDKMDMKVRYMDPIDHDFHLAFVSHLSHVSSFMLARTVMEEEKNERNIFDMAGSGFASTVRLAKSSPDMWTPIFRQNKSNLLRAISGYVHHLNKFQALIEHEKWDEIHEEMSAINDIKRILKNID